MKLNPLKMKDWQIAQAAEEDMKSVGRLAEDFQLKKGELLPMGKTLARLDYEKILDRLNNENNSKYIDITSITPTPLGEGKTTTTIGLIQALGKLQKKVTGAIRQPSSGPTFNIKGSAAGGGLSQCIPLVPLSIRLTGDIDHITNAHNLAMVALNARMQHERNYDNAQLSKRNLNRLDIDPANIKFRWVMDFCAQSLRNITIGKGTKTDGFEMESGFDIAASSELMAILSVTKNLGEMRKRISRVVLAHDKNGNEVTTADLEVDGAMTAWMTDTINPTLLQTIEGQPVLVHAGPFANIAIGQSSIIADLVGLKLSDYHIAESGFGSNIGYEKFWNLKCRLSNLKPDAVVIVATVRALKMHGGGPPVKPGSKLAPQYEQENLELVEKGCENLKAHIDIVKKSGIKPVVCVNKFHTDTKDEIKLVNKIAEQYGAVSVTSNHWLKGGEGAIELADAVISACEDENHFHYLYPQKMPLAEKIETIAKQIYGAAGVTYSSKAKEKAEIFQEKSWPKKFGTCMLKTRLSLSHDPNLKGRPRNWELPIKDFYVYKGAELIVPIAGQVKLMPGTGSDPAYRRIDVDTQTGKVTGLF